MLGPEKEQEMSRKKVLVICQWAWQGSAALLVKPSIVADRGNGADRGATSFCWKVDGV